MSRRHLELDCDLNLVDQIEHQGVKYSEHIWVVGAEVVEDNKRIRGVSQHFSSTVLGNRYCLVVLQVVHRNRESN